MFPSSEITPTGVLFKVFIKGEDGQWRIVSFHVSRRAAESTANLIVVRDGLIACVML
jgi:hypothetical protein